MTTCQPMFNSRKLNFVRYDKSNDNNGERLKEEELKMPAPKDYLYPIDDTYRLVTAKKPIRKVGLGLQNRGNTCYLNSVLQALTYTAPFAFYFTSGDHFNKCELKETGQFCMTCQLGRHINNALAQDRRGSVTPTTVINNLKSIGKHLRAGRQEDAHEFLRLLLDACHRSFIPARGKNEKLPMTVSHTTIIHQLFGGYLRSQVKCHSCKFASNTFDPFLDLSLELNKCQSIIQALQQFTQKETLSGTNKYRCSQCKRLVDAEKQFLVHRAPHILTLQLKRFNYGIDVGGKINRAITFEDELDLSPFCSNEVQRQDAIYKLFAITVHAGSSMKSGHYYSFARNFGSQDWYRFDDEHVAPAPRDVVFKSQAYLLFYERKEPRDMTPTKKMDNVKSKVQSAKLQPSSLRPSGVANQDIFSSEGSSNSVASNGNQQLSSTCAVKNENIPATQTKEEESSESAPSADNHKSRSKNIGMIGPQLPPTQEETLPKRDDNLSLGPVVTKLKENKRKEESPTKKNTKSAEEDSPSESKKSSKIPVPEAARGAKIPKRQENKTKIRLDHLHEDHSPSPERNSQSSTAPTPGDLPPHALAPRSRKVTPIERKNTVSSEEKVIDSFPTPSMSGKIRSGFPMAATQAIKAQENKETTAATQAAKVQENKEALDGKLINPLKLNYAESSSESEKSRKSRSSFSKKGFSTPLDKINRINIQAENAKRLRESDEGELSSKRPRTPTVPEMEAFVPSKSTEKPHSACSSSSGSRCSVARKIKDAREFAAGESRSREEKEPAASPEVPDDSQTKRRSRSTSRNRHGGIRKDDNANTPNLEPTEVIRAGIARERRQHARRYDTQFGTANVETWDNEGKASADPSIQRTMQPSVEVRDAVDKEYDQGKAKHKVKKVAENIPTTSQFNTAANDRISNKKQ